jgi:hypothetical protein
MPAADDALLTVAKWHGIVPRSDCGRDCTKLAQV